MPCLQARGTKDCNKGIKSSKEVEIKSLSYQKLSSSREIGYSGYFLREKHFFKLWLSSDMEAQIDLRSTKLVIPLDTSEPVSSGFLRLR